MRNLAAGFERLDSRRVLASITGVVYADLDLSGTQDVGEAGLADRIVYLDQNHDQHLSFGEPVQRTDSGGQFSFEELEVSGQTVRLFDGTSTQQVTAPQSGTHQVVLSSIDTVAEISFGVSVAGENDAPTSEPVTYQVNQDNSFVVLFPTGLVHKHGDDAPSHTFIALQTSESENGDIDIDALGGVRYQALEGFVGQDTATYVLHDGRDASDPITLTVEVLPNGQPLQSIILEGEPLIENSPEGTVIGRLVLPDVNMQHVDVFTVFDPRVRIEDDLLILADPAAVNFEMDPELRVVVFGVDEEVGEEVVQWEVVVPIADANDPITSIMAPTPTDVLIEHAVGTEIGAVIVEDEDVGEVHEVQVDNDRFEVVNYILKLRDDMSLVYPDDDGLVLTIFVNDPANDGAPISDQMTLTVQNINDPPTALHAGGDLREQTLGAIVGPVTVSDPDPDSVYAFTTSDFRFEVIDGILKLKDDESVLYDVNDPVITLTLTATETGDSNHSIEANIGIPIIESPSPWQNLPEQMDVNNDGSITPQDALIILNALNEGGPRVLDFPFSGDFYIDVNGDGLLTPLDALILVNELNSITTLRSIPGGGFPPIGEAEFEDSLPQPEGEAITQSPQTLPEGEHAGTQWRLAAASTAGALPTAKDEAFDDQEDWIAPEIEAFFV